MEECINKMWGCLKSGFRFVLGIEYRELKADWEKQNITIDELTLERNRKQKRIELLTRNKVELEDKEKVYLKDIEDLREGLKAATLRIKQQEKDLKDQKEKYEKDLERKEEQRKQLACRIGGYVTENNKLKDQVDFLKTCKRAPNLEELKNYTLRRKSVCKKK